MALINAIDLTVSYLIISVITNKVYLDEERNAYLFFSKNEAAAFVMETEDTTVQEGTYKSKEDFLSECYAAGARKVIIHSGTGTKEMVSLGENRVKLDFYNSMLNASVSLLRETKKSKYMIDIAKERFIVPVKINNDDGQVILYGVVRASGANKEDYRYLAFTDLKEFQAWAEKVQGWKPLSVSFDTMIQIGKNHGYMVNPFGNRLVLSYENMVKFRARREALS